MTIEQQLAIEAAATKAPWCMEQPWAGFSGFRSPDNKLIFATASPKAECERPQEDHDETLCARNHHRANLEVARAAEAVVDAWMIADSCTVHELVTALRAALAAMEEIR